EAGRAVPAPRPRRRRGRQHARESLGSRGGVRQVLQPTERGCRRSGRRREGRRWKGGRVVVDVGELQCAGRRGRQVQGRYAIATVAKNGGSRSTGGHGDLRVQSGDEGGKTTPAGAGGCRCVRG
ncbi:unnamed protein product, partial [Ectocarpus sp. 12 AP-2014]